MIEPISIISSNSVSAIGATSHEAYLAYCKPDHNLSYKEINGEKYHVGQIAQYIKEEIAKIANENKNYKKLDESVLNAIYVSRKAIKKAQWTEEKNIGINIGSSRGATQLFEKFYQQFLESNTTHILSSPNTTLGNISSWVAQDTQNHGPEFSHSITCSTGLHAVLNGVAWINSGMADKFLVGASEAALTSFTLKQLELLKIYSKRNLKPYPCLSFDLDKKENTMVLGEAAAVLCLEKGLQENRLASIKGVGYATEKLEHSTSLSQQGNCMYKAMQNAIKSINIEDIDAIIMHAPGTIKGDLSEYNAIKNLFGKNMPYLSSNKWKLGHTFATSGILNIEMALFMLSYQKTFDIPYLKKQNKAKRLKNILVNAVGFGGNAVSILISK